MAVGKRYDTSEPLTEHDVAARLDKAVERVFRIMLDARRLGLAEQVLHSRYLTHPSLGILRAELDAWGVTPAPFDGQLDELTADAQAVADAYSQWLSKPPTTGAPMSEQSTEQQPEGTESTGQDGGTTVNVTGSEPDVNVHGSGPSGDDSTGTADSADDNAGQDDATE